MSGCAECHYTGEQQGYGFFPGGDPRNFSPDPECSTPEERENHRLACDEWEKNGTPTAPDACSLLTGGEPRVAFGLGVYTYPCECTPDLP